MKPGGRYLIAIGVPECPQLGLPPLAGVATDVTRIADLLTDVTQGYERVLDDRIALGTTSGTMLAELHAWFGSAERSPDDYVVIYFAGHGEVSSGRFEEHCLLTSDAQDNRPDTVFRTAEFASIFFNGPLRPQNVLLVLDVCYAGRGSGDVLVRTLEQGCLAPDGAGFWVLAATGSDSIAADGAFVDGFYAALCDAQYRPASGAAYFTPSDLARAISRWLEHHRRAQRAYCSAIGAGASDAFFFRHPTFAPLANEAGEGNALFWEHAASGADIPGSDDRFFSGRRSALRAAHGWLRNVAPQRPALVVTGLPGSGKSALLANLILDKDEAGGTHFDVCLLATKDSLINLTHKVAIALDCRAREPLQLVAELHRSARRATIAIDGLDEAREPDLIEYQLLQPLSDCTGIRLILGTRRRGEGIALGERALVIDLDAPDFFDSQDVVDYVAKRLARGGPHVNYAAPEDQQAATDIAQYIARAAGTSFLCARLVCRAVLSLTATIDTSKPGWEQQIPVPGSIDSAYTLDFQRYDAIKRRRFIDLLMPLAFAQGKGLPIGSLWLSIAGRLGGNAYTNDSLFELIEEAGFFLIQESEHGHPVFRLFHQTFVEFLIKRRPNAQGALLFFNALERYATGERGDLDFSSVKERYVLRYFAAHAAAANQLDHYLESPAYLLAVRPAELLAELSGVCSERGRLLASAYRSTCHWWREDRENNFLSYFGLSCAERGVTDVMAKMNARNQDARWHPLAALGVPGASSQVYARGTESISSLAVLTDWNGDTIAVCGYASGGLRLWNISCDKLVAELVRPNEFSGTANGRESAKVAHLEVLRRGRALHIAAVFGERVLAIYEMSPEWVCVSCSCICTEKVQALCFSENGNAPVLVTAGGLMLSVWTLADLTPVDSVTNASKAEIYGLAPFILDGKSVVAVVNDTYRSAKKVEDDIVRIWEVAGLRLRFSAGHPRMGLGSYVHVCSVSGRTKVVVADISGNACVFDPQGSPPSFHPYQCNAFGRSEGVGNVCHSASGEFESRLVSYLHGRLTVASVRAVASHPDAVHIVQGEGECRLGNGHCRVTHDGLWLVAADDRQLRTFRLADIFDAQSPVMADYQAFFRSRDIKRAVEYRGLFIIGDHVGGLSCWRNDGTCMWHQELAGGRITSIVLTTRGEDQVLLVATYGAVLHQLVPATGFSIADCINLPGEIAALQTVAIRGTQLCFAIVNETFCGSMFYAVRVWDLLRGTELDTQVAEGYEPSQGLSSRAFEFRSDEPRHGFVMEDYFKTKRMPCSLTYRRGKQWLVMCGGAHGEVRVIDYDTLFEVDCWVNNTERHKSAYVRAIAAADCDGATFVLASNDYGGLCMRTLRGHPAASADGGHAQSDPHDHDTRVFNDSAHCEGVYSLAAFPWDPPIFLSGGQDGVVNVWTIEMNLLERIELNAPVVALEILENDALLVTTNIGIVKLQFYRHISASRISQQAWGFKRVC